MAMEETSSETCSVKDGRQELESLTQKAREMAASDPEWARYGERSDIVAELRRNCILAKYKFQLAMGVCEVHQNRSAKETVDSRNTSSTSVPISVETDILGGYGTSTHFDSTGKTFVPSEGIGNPVRESCFVTENKINRGRFLDEPSPLLSPHSSGEHLQDDVFEYGMEDGEIGAEEPHCKKTRSQQGENQRRKQSASKKVQDAAATDPAGKTLQKYVIRGSGSEAVLVVSPRQRIPLLPTPSTKKADGNLPDSSQCETVTNSKQRSRARLAVTQKSSKSTDSNAADQLSFANHRSDKRNAGTGDSQRMPSLNPLISKQANMDVTGAPRNQQSDRFVFAPDPPRAPVALSQPSQISPLYPTSPQQVSTTCPTSPPQTAACPRGDTLVCPNSRVGIGRARKSIPKSKSTPSVVQHHSVSSNSQSPPQDHTHLLASGSIPGPSTSSVVPGGPSQDPHPSRKREKPSVQGTATASGLRKPDKERINKKPNFVEESDDLLGCISKSMTQTTRQIKKRQPTDDGSSSSTKTSFQSNSTFGNKMRKVAAADSGNTSTTSSRESLESIHSNNKGSHQRRSVLIAPRPKRTSGGYNRRSW